MANKLNTKWLFTVKPWHRPGNWHPGNKGSWIRWSFWMIYTGSKTAKRSHIAEKAFENIKSILKKKCETNEIDCHKWQHSCQRLPFSYIYFYSKARIQESLNRNQGALRRKRVPGPRRVRCRFHECEVHLIKIYWLPLKPRKVKYTKLIPFLDDLNSNCRSLHYQQLTMYTEVLLQRV